MRSPSRSPAALLGVVGGALALLGGCPLVPDPGLHRQSPVVLVGTEQLAPPAVLFGEDVFAPAYTFEQPGVGEVAGFFVTVWTSDADAIQAELIPRRGVPLAAARVDAREAPTELASLPQPFDATVRGTLAQQRPVFWHDPAGSDALRQRLAFLVPVELLTGSSTRLSVFTNTTLTGAPIGPATLQLARDFFYLAIIGDSIMWGNGLEERDKLTTHTINTLEQGLNQKVIWQRYALSGATIVPAPDDGTCGVGCFGEAPLVMTSITGQVDQIERPDLMDLILMDGCINDVGLITIINPLTTDEQLLRLTERFCHDEMTNLLTKVRSAAPQAHIVVTSYFPIVGPESDILALQAWAGARGIEPIDPNGTLSEELAEQSRLFHDASSAGLRAAVAEVNDETEGTPVAFANAQFTPENAVFSPNEWLWSLTQQNRLLENLDLGLGLDVFPADPLATVRAELCLDSEEPGDVVSCIFASIGHPNPLGAEAYANAIAATLRDLGILPDE